MADQMSPDQVAQVQEVFSFFDKDGDGAIVIKELGPVLRSLGFNPEEAEINALIDEHDKDGGGSMEFPDFLALVPKVKRQGDSFEEVDEAFQVFDKENNGMVSAAELRHIMTNMGEKLSDEEVDQMIACADADAQGEINYKDFIKMLLTD